MKLQDLLLNYMYVLGLLVCLKTSKECVIDVNEKPARLWISTCTFGITQYYLLALKYVLFMII